MKNIIGNTMKNLLKDFASKIIKYCLDVTYREEDGGANIYLNPDKLEKEINLVLFGKTV